jgi:hypothetical protein
MPDQPSPELIRDGFAAVKAGLPEPVKRKEPQHG